MFLAWVINLGKPYQVGYFCVLMDRSMQIKPAPTQFFTHSIYLRRIPNEKEIHQPAHGCHS